MGKRKTLIDSDSSDDGSGSDFDSVSKNSINI